MAESPPLSSLNDDAEPNFRPAAGAVPASPAPHASAAGLRIRVGATSADIETLYRSHCAKVCNYFRRCGEAEAVAVELAQDTYIQALRGCAQFDGRSQLSTWLWAIARNVFLGHLRKQGRRLDGAQGDAATGVEPDSLSSPQSGRQMELDACLRRGFAAFAQHHPERAQVLYLAAVEGWSSEELATHLGRTPHAATEYLSQCRTKLRPYVEGCGAD